MEKKHCSFRENYTREQICGFLSDIAQIAVFFTQVGGRWICRRLTQFSLFDIKARGTANEPLGVVGDLLQMRRKKRNWVNLLYFKHSSTEHKR
jgi:hypothetical protein